MTPPRELRVIEQKKLLVSVRKAAQILDVSQGCFKVVCG